LWGFILFYFIFYNPSLIYKQMKSPHHE